MAYDGEDRIESKNLLVISEKSPEPAADGKRYGKQGAMVRVVQWIFDGKGKAKGEVRGSVALEKRESYVNEDGEIRTGKAKGFSLEDLAAIQARWKEIVEVMKNPPAPVFTGGGSSSATRAQSKAQPTDDIEEVPF